MPVLRYNYESYRLTAYCEASDDFRKEFPNRFPYLREAYALQTYYNGELLTNQIYHLRAGEFGIGHSLKTDAYNVTSYHDLCSYYSNFSSQARNIVYNIACELYTNPNQYLGPMKNTVGSTEEFQTMILNLTNFVEEQMIRDSRAMNFDIEHLNMNLLSAN